jgi:hypothetical protein
MELSTINKVSLVWKFRTITLDEQGTSSAWNIKFSLHMHICVYRTPSCRSVLGNNSPTARNTSVCQSQANPTFPLHNLSGNIQQA